MQNFWPQLWRILTPAKSNIKKIFLTLLVLEGLALVSPYLVKLVIDSISNFQPKDLTHLLFLLGALFIFNQVTSIIGYFFDKKIIKTSIDITLDLNKRSQEQMVYLGLTYHEKENTGAKISKIQRGVENVQRLFEDMAWQAVPSIVQAIFTAIILFWMDWRFGLVFIFFCPFFLWLTLKLNRLVRPVRKSMHDDFEKKSNKMTQGILNINTVKSFVQEKRESSEFNVISRSANNKTVSIYNTIFKFNLGRDFIINSGEIAIIILGIFLLLNDQITIGSLVFVITISQKSLTSLYKLSRLYDRIMESSEAVKRLSDLFNEERESLGGKLKPLTIKGEFKFQNIEFSYDKVKQALKNVSFTIPAGKMTALVGPSGGGKTTIARLIYKHYLPQKGIILLDGKNLNDYNIHALRRLIAIVPQETELFNMSTHDNIAYGNPKATHKQVQQAAKIANAHEFINELKEGYQSIVGERGVKLSGGQRQRIGIARAILANPRILIFDEATSNLDSQSESLIQDALEKIAHSRTLIVIAHRLSTIKKADKIIVLEKGRLCEEGDHRILSNKKAGLYAELLKLQRMGEVR
ncbi:MAG: ABC transporter ATP-binding protein [Candidatus Falkowbacteria bacterium]|nr:ABC transporter ATP-binding protein [Candidatus Falkowbacteria bacterium]